MGWIATAIKWCVPILNFLWEAMKIPHTLEDMRENHLKHLSDDVQEIKADVKGVIREQAEQRGICKATREQLGIRAIKE